MSLIDFFDPKQTPMYLVILIHGGKWINDYIWSKGESTEALAGRIALCEGTLKVLKEGIDQGNANLSDKMTRLTNYLEERRSELDAVRAHVMELSGEMKAMREFRNPDDRRR